MDDMLSQFEQVQRLGPLSGILKMFPGFSQYSDMIDEVKATDAMKHTKAIIQSMTKKERRNPSAMRGSMKRRVAMGSGTTVQDVNRLINQYEKMKTAMEAVGNMQKNGSLNEETLNRMMNNLESGGGQQPVRRVKRKRYKF